MGHATVLLELDGRRVLTDPFLRSSLGPLARHGPVPDPERLGSIDLVVISHGHPDHLDHRSLAALQGTPLVVAPRGLGAAIARRTGLETIEVEAGDVIEARGVSLTAIPARHWISPGAARATPIGYLIERGAAVYFAGDTGRVAGAFAALRGRVDLALLPVATWGPHLGPGHLGPLAAAHALASIEPSAAVPIHWGTLYPRHLHRVLRAPLAEPGDRFRAHAARLAASTDVRVLQPGEAATFAIEDGRRSRA